MRVDIEQLNNSIMKVKSLVERIKNESEKLKEINNIYRKDLQDQTSEDVDKNINNIKNHTEELYTHFEEIIDILKKANDEIYELESNKIII